MAVNIGVGDIAATRVKILPIKNVSIATNPQKIKPTIPKKLAQPPADFK
jgi:hypothetical protein